MKIFELYKISLCKCLSQNGPMPSIIYYWRAIKAFLQTFTTFCQLCQLFTISYCFANYLQQYSTLSWSDSFKIIIQSSLLYFYFCVYVQELFSVSWNKFHIMEHFSYLLVMEHHINLSLALDPHFNSSMWLELLFLSVRQQHHLKIHSL